MLHCDSQYRSYQRAFHIIGLLANILLDLVMGGGEGASGRREGGGKGRVGLSEGEKRNANAWGFEFRG